MATAELPEMPNGPILELYGQRKRFHVPHGLKPLLEEITTETLRYQPEDIYVFLAQYVDAKLLKTRGERKSKTDQEPKMTPDIDEETEDLLDELRLSKADADRYATKIQAAFRGHSVRRTLNSKGQVIHKDHRKSWEWKKWGWEGSSELEEEDVTEMLEEFHVTKDDADKAATKIQSLFRGHRDRKNLEKRGIQSKNRQTTVNVIKPSIDGGDEEEEGEGEEFTDAEETLEVEEAAEAPAEVSAGEEEAEQSEPETVPEETESAPEAEAAPTGNETEEEETEAEQPTADGTARESTAGEETSAFSEGEAQEGLTAESTEEEEETEAEG